MKWRVSISLEEKTWDFWELHSAVCSVKSKGKGKVVGVCVGGGGGLSNAREIL
jgi:hypothetical protein